MMEGFSPNIFDYLQRNRIGRLAAASRNGIPHLTAVGYINDKERIIVCASSNTKKIRLIRENSKVSFLVDDAGGSSGWRYVLIEGNAKLIEEGVRFQSLKQLMCIKYPEMEEGEWAIRQGFHSFIMIKPNRVLTANLTP
jgi:nitroimidazol reductase NimA-like FMN-containing flavoprotein (pyridoxamine 5'-phosphate oxidase superfamily)